MARVMLIMPRLPQRMGAPYLGQQYVAASLLAAGHEVRVLDLAAPYFDGGDDAAVQEVEGWGPDLVGMTLFTYNAARGYALARRLRAATRTLVAGGAHPTVCPGEPVALGGFDIALAGEGERAIVQLAAALDAGDDAAIDDLPGVWSRRTAEARPWQTLDDLDSLAPPMDSYPAFDMRWYTPGGQTIVPGGLMTSRGCPARCTFCANYVTGRSYRWRSAPSVVAEMVALRERYGVTHFPFWDDAFTALRPRLNELCDAMLAEPALRGVTWTCITPGNMVKPFDLERMREAGCLAVNFGIESGDYNVLRTIQKGQRPEHVRAAVRAASDAGMTTIVNFMFGFPEEGTDQLDRTHELMESLAEDVDFFNNRGVLVPFPGTAIYDRWHGEYDFAGWWLDEARVPMEPDLHAMTPEAVAEALETDPTLEQDFFRYSRAVRERIEECVRFKARHNQRTIARMQGGAAAA